MTERRLAHYELLEKIGQGGMGEVYRARDTQLDRDVAIKILPHVFSQETERLARFEREAKLLASLNDSGIAAVYGLHEEGGTRFLAMELVPGEDLTGRMAERRLPLEEALEIAAQVAGALEVAHENGVIHRDLKLSNVMVTPDGKAKVLDFGLAKSLDRSAASGSGVVLTQSPTLAPMGTMAGMILGTAAYMSPEQARGKPLDRRTDIWSFGVILFEMLSGRQLFEGQTLSDTMAEVLKSEIDWSELPKETPSSVRQLLERCLDRDPRSRLRDIGEARVVLANPTESDDSRQADAGATSRGRRFAFLGLAAGLIVGAAITAWLLRASQAPVAAPVTSTKTVLEVPLQDRAAAPRAAFSPDGRRLAFVDAGQIWVRDLDRLDARPVPGTENAHCPFWSHDGRWIAYSQASRLFKIPAEGGDPFILCDVPGGLHDWAGQGVWRDDGHIYFVPGDGGIFSVPDQGGDPVEILAPAEGETDFHQLSAAPDGTLFFVTHEGPYFPAIHALRNGERHELLRLDDQALGFATFSREHLIFLRGPSNQGVWAVPFSLADLRTAGEPFLLIPGGAFPTATTDGSLLHVIPTPPRLCQIAVVAANGALVRRIGEPGMDLTDIAVSRDGRHVAFVQQADTQQDLWILESATGAKRRLTFGPEPSTEPAWSPDGTHLAARTGGPALGNARLLVRSAASGSVTLDLGLATAPTFSPDGRWIAYVGYNAGFDPAIWYSSADGSEAPVVFFDSNVNEFSPQFSPDGRHLAFMSNVSGRDEVYVRPFPGGETQWQVSYNGGQFPKWSPDGTRLCYSLHGELFQVAVTRAGDAISFAAPTRVMDLRGIVSLEPTEKPDEFLVIRLENPDERIPGLAVTLNWDADLRTSAAD
jgi:Tol biopolymer transport system component